MKSKKYILFFSGIFFLVNTYGQTKISLTGKVTDAKTGDPLTGASIYLADDKIGTTADINGKYIFRNIPPGHHVIEVSYTGYGTLTEHLEIIADTEKDFALTTVVIENEGVTVTGVAGATTIRKSPVAITSLKKTALLQNAFTNIIDALAHLPGVSQLSTGPAISKPVIRGLGYNRIVTINEGLRQEGQQWGDEHGIEIDEMSIGRVEVLKGPASLMYGSDALAGVINFITSNPIADGAMKGNILSNFQSNNGLVAINGNLAANKKGVNWNLYGTYKSAGNYRNRFDGSVLNSGFNEKNVGGYFGINKSWGYSHFIFSRFNQQIGLVEGERDDATGQFILFGGSPVERIATEADLNTRSLFVPKQRVIHHKLILDTCLGRLQQQVMDYPIVFNLLPEKFSLRQLQELYEAILGVNLDRRNFRKKISIKDWLIDIDEMENDVPHRPGKLYKLKPEFKQKGYRKKGITGKQVIV